MTRFRDGRSPTTLDYTCSNEAVQRKLVPKRVESEAEEEECEEECEEAQEGEKPDQGPSFQKKSAQGDGQPDPDHMSK